MALSFSNTVSSPAGVALSNKSQLNLSNLGMPTVPGVTNQNVLPTALRTPVTAPVTPIKPAVAAPLASAPLTQSTGSQSGATDNNALLASLQKQLADKQAQLASQQNMDKATATAASKGLIAPPSQTPTYGGLIGSLSGNAATTASQGQMTQEEKDARAKLAGIPGVLGAANAQIESTPSENAVQMGREAVAGRNVEAQRQSLADQVAAYAAERGANVQADTAAGTQYGTAAGLLAPQQVSYSNQYLNPTTGTAINPQAGQDMQTAVNTQVQRVLANNSDLPTAIAALGAYGQAGMNALQQALGPNFNVAANAGAVSATQSNTATAGTTNTNIAASGLTDAVHTYQNMVQANSTADSQATQVKNILASTGLNSGVQDFNKAINTLGARLGSANVTALTTGIVELQNAYSQLLNTSGNTPSGAEAQALAVLNPNSSASQITAAITVLQNAAANKLTAAQQKAATYNSNLNGTGVSGGSSGSSGSTASEGSTTSAGGYKFVFKGGKWVPA